MIYVLLLCKLIILTRFRFLICTVEQLCLLDFIYLHIPKVQDASVQHVNPNFFYDMVLMHFCSCVDEKAILKDYLFQ